ncbi:MAG: CDP-diacylglycerol--glycerol-3-phosphate 3-phosphatidyltransferase [Bacilli bacterium]|nr:CDP-diacylglycerol--glycerol-3-phosphate 3-phosphatidyltransferase [Bacilli bacterium]
MNLPTKITFSRIIAIVVLILTLFVLFIVKQFNPGFISPDLGNSGINAVFLAVFVFFLIASYTDHLDGKLARKNNQVTALGKFLDPVADKLLINSMVIFLIAPQIFASYAPNQMGFCMWCAILLVARDIVVDALRFIAAEKGVVIAANIFGKLKTVLEMVAICFVLLNDWPFALIYGTNCPKGLTVTDFLVYLATLASVVSGIIYVVQNRKVFIGDKSHD